MNLKIAFALGIYWSLMILFFGVGDTLANDSFGNPLSDGGFNTSAVINDTGFSSDEIDEDTGGIWGFFSGIAGIFVAMGRIIVFTAFGISTTLTGLSQVLVSTWQTFMTIFTIMFVISAFWDG